MSPRRQPNYAYAPIESIYFTIICCLFVSVMIISNISATVPVIFHIGSFAPNSDGAFFIFPISYILGDVLTEVYGLRAARKVVFIGFGVLILTALCFHISAAMPHGHTGDPTDPVAVSAFNQIAVSSTIFIIAGLGGYICGELMNTLAISKLKSKDGERKLWLRLFIATIVSEFLDTGVFCLIAAHALGYNSFHAIANYTIYGFIWKCLVELAVMPITYNICKYLKKHEKNYTHHYAEPTTLSEMLT